MKTWNVNSLLMKDTALELEWHILFSNGPVARDSFKSTMISFSLGVSGLT